MLNMRGSLRLISNAGAMPALNSELTCNQDSAWCWPWALSGASRKPPRFKSLPHLPTLRLTSPQSNSV